MYIDVASSRVREAIHKEDLFVLLPSLSLCSLSWQSRVLKDTQGGFALQL